MLFRVPSNISHVQGKKVVVESLRVMVLNVMVAFQEGLNRLLKLVWEGIGRGRRSEGGSESLEGLSHRSRPACQHLLWW